MSIETDLGGEKEFSFIPKYKNLIDIMTDHELAALGDAYVNFIYSLALSKALGKPIGRKISSSALASALKKADLRKFLPSRVDRHKQADAAEALIVYAWLLGRISLKETLITLEQEAMVEDAFGLLLKTILKKINLNSAVTI